MYSGLLVRYGELYLKTNFVRRQFERILMDNIRRELKELKIKARTKLLFGRIVIETDDIRKASAALEHTFGVISFSPAITCEKNYPDIKKNSIRIAKTFRKGTFAVDARRSDKSFRPNSQQLKEKIGREICKMGHRVDLSKPDNRLCIEIRDGCYIYSKSTAGPGGMPLGTGGRVAGFLLSKGGLAAAWLMMKRGVEVVAIGKCDKKLYSILEKWSTGRKLKTAKNITEARKNGAIAVIGKKKKSAMVVFNPLVGYDKDDFEKLYEFISR